MAGEKILIITGAQEFRLFDGERLSDAPPKLLKDSYSAAALNASLVLTHGMRVAQNISPEKLEIQAEMSMYEEAGLDPEVDFTIASVGVDLERENERYVESYAIETKALEEQYAKAASKLGQIDYIIPSFLRYGALYSYEKLEPKNDVFIYFGDDEAYAATYKEGEYIATRSIMTLGEMAQKLEIDVATLKELLKNRGVVNENYTPEMFLQMHTIQEEFSKILERIAHAISHKRGVFGLESIDRFFLDFEGNDIPGFLENFANYGFEGAECLTLNAFESLEGSDQKDALFGLYVLGAVTGRYEVANLSVFERQPPFYKTHSGIFFAMLSIAVVAGLAYPLYAQYRLDALEAYKAELQNRFDAMTALNKKLQSKLKETRTERDVQRQMLQAHEARIAGYDLLVDALQEQRKMKLSRQQMMQDVNEAMRTYKLSSRNLEQNGTDVMKIHLISEFDKRDDIAKFMKQLLTKGYRGVSTEAISLEENLYESIVEIRP